MYCESTNTGQFYSSSCSCRWHFCGHRSISRANTALTYTQQLPEQQYPMAAPWDSTAKTGNKLQSYCECWSGGKTEIDGTVEIHLTHTHTHTSRPCCKSCTVRMYCWVEPNWNIHYCYTELKHGPWFYWSLKCVDVHTPVCVCLCVYFQCTSLQPNLNHWTDTSQLFDLTLDFDL